MSRDFVKNEYSISQFPLKYIKIPMYSGADKLPVSYLNCINAVADHVLLIFTGIQTHLLRLLW